MVIGMKSILKYTLTLVFAFSFIACSMDDIDTSISNSGTTIEFIARPTSFISTNVTTKATEDKVDWENYVYNAYLLLFDKDDKLIDITGGEFPSPVSLKISESNEILPCRFTLAEGSFETAYILANISSDISAIQSVSDLEGTVLEGLNYITGSSYLAAPTIDGTNPSLPMIGVAKFDNKDGNKVIIELERLFAKVNLNVTMNLQNSTGLLNRANFLLKSVELNDLPTLVSIVANSNESPWATKDYEDIQRLDYSIEDINQTIYEGSNALDEYIGTVTNYSCVAYIPEYKLFPKQPINETESSKPLNFDSESKVPVYITVKGDFIHSNLNNGTGIPFTYKLYLGGNNFDNFCLYRNKSYNCKMTITGIDDARLEIDSRVEADFGDPINLAADEPANCYVISQIGRYQFPAVEGNLKEASIADNIPHSDDGLISSDYYDLQTDNTSNTVTNIRLIDDKITFDVNMDSLSPVEYGNTMLIIKNKNKQILWSWHLWFCKHGDSPYDTCEKYVDDDGLFNGYRVMNRALGAKNSTGIDLTVFGESNYALWKDGLYYQWGDKDPRLGQDYIGGVANGSWSGDKKTKTDPCPPGFRVPSGKVWRTTNPDDDYAIEVAGVKLHLSSEVRYAYNLSQGTGDNAPSNFILYAYPGYYDEDQNLVDTSPQPINDETPDGFQNKYNDVKVGDSRRLVPYPGISIKFTNVKFKYNATVTTGALWTSDDTKPLLYGFGGNVQSGLLSDVVITELTYEQATVSTSESGSIVKTYKVTAVKWDKAQTIDKTQIDQKIDGSENWRLAILALKEDINSKYVKSTSGFSYTHPYSQDSVEYSSDCGLQVRCVLDE